MQPGGSTEATWVSATVMALFYFFLLKHVKTELFKKWFGFFSSENVLIFILSVAGIEATSSEVTGLMQK